MTASPIILRPTPTSLSSEHLSKGCSNYVQKSWSHAIDVLYVIYIVHYTFIFFWDEGGGPDISVFKDKCLSLIRPWYDTKQL